MIETQLGLDPFHHLMREGKGNTMIWAPRQSGKTFALVRKFVETHNSVLLCVGGQMRRTVDDYLVRLGCPDRRRDVYASFDVMRGRRVDYIFLDEIDHYRGNLQDVWASIRPAGGRIIAVSTPSGVRQRNEYSIFSNEYTLTMDGITQWREPQIKVLDLMLPPDYFETEKELFTI